MDITVLKIFFETDTKKIIENKELLSARNWHVIKSEFPLFILSMQHPKSKKEYIFRYLCDDFPISVQIVSLSDFSPLPYDGWPKGSYFLNGHSQNQEPFLCAPGVREYHTHSSHSSEQWDFSSPTFRLPSLIDTVYCHFKNTES